MTETLLRRRDGELLELRLNRPQLRNALDEELIARLTAAVREAPDQEGVRALLLSGEGKSFCAGADIHYMRRMGDFDEAANFEDAGRLGALFQAIASCPLPVIGQVHGAAIGGGMGLVAACDVVVAAEATIFAFSEVRLGILPATISPFVLRRIGPGAARRLFLTGERFDAVEAHRLGLVDLVVPPERMAEAIGRLREDLRQGGPKAQAAIKQLLDEVTPLPTEEAARRTPAWIARQRATDEAREGMQAFFEKRPCAWAKEAGS